MIGAAAADGPRGCSDSKPTRFIFSLENAVCKDSHRRIRGLPVLLPYSSVRILTDSFVQRENKRAWGRSFRGVPPSRGRLADLRQVQPTEYLLR